MPPPLFLHYRGARPDFTGSLFCSFSDPDPTHPDLIASTELPPWYAGILPVVSASMATISVPSLPFCHNSCNLSTGQALSEPVGTYNKTHDMATCDDDDPIADAFDDSLLYSYDGDDDGFWVDGDTISGVRRMCIYISTKLPQGSDCNM